MTNKERYKQAFGTLHASKDFCLEAEMNRNGIYAIRRTVLVAICAALLLGLGITAYAYGGQLLEVLGWGGNSTISRSYNEKGEPVSITVLHTENLTEPVEISDGRMYFIVNGEHIDITDDMLAGESVTYYYVDGDGNTHIWIVGLNSDELLNYGYAEFIRAANGEWLGGYSARVNIDENNQTVPWLENGKKQFNIPW